ncbi:MAG: dTMP kinase [Nitrospinota bacterium]|jgi:dTMP kinase|nr:dTMP kinase [Nitrospinota bacterium]MDP7385137.1 dTMP kinase [Nitrospinota bacterium]
MAGILITFEGIEGSGKTTQASMLAERLREHGVSVFRTREPGGTHLGEGIRRLVLDPGQEAIDPVAELFLMEAARAQHVAAKIHPALDAGKVVLCDRFTDSTLVYQGLARGLAWNTIEDVNLLASKGVRPRTTILLDLDISVGLARTHTRADSAVQADGSMEAGETNRFDLEDREFHEIVRSGFLRLAKEDPGRVKVVRAAGSPEQVHEEVWRALEKTLESAAPCG